MPPDSADTDGFESADEALSERHSTGPIRLESAANSFSDVSLASERRSSSPVRSPSRLSRQSLAEHQAATDGNGPVAAGAIPSWTTGIQQLAQSGSAAGSLEEAIPEMLRIKDLDSGKEYNLDKARGHTAAAVADAVLYVTAQRAQCSIYKMARAKFCNFGFLCHAVKALVACSAPAFSPLSIGLLHPESGTALLTVSLCLSICLCLIVHAPQQLCRGARTLIHFCLARL